MVSLKIQAITSQRGVHRKSRAARIVSLPSVHAAGVGVLCFIGWRGFPEESCSRWVLSDLVVLDLNTSMAPLARTKSIKATCGPAPPAAVYIVRASSPGSASSSCPSCSQKLQPTFLFRHLKHDGVAMARVAMTMGSNTDSLAHGARFGGLPCLRDCVRRDSTYLVPVVSQSRRLGKLQRC